VQKVKGNRGDLPRPDPRSPISKLLRSFYFAAQGIAHTFRTQPNARIEAAIAGIIVILGAWLRVDRTQWAILVVCIGLVLGLEILNTGIEALVDLASPDHHPLAKVAKDAAAGAVFWAAILSVIVGLLILGPPLWGKLGDLLIR
jgi:diacylglycerol kinase